MPIRIQPPTNLPRRRATTRDIIENTNDRLYNEYRQFEEQRRALQDQPAHRMDFMGTLPTIEPESLENLQKLEKNPRRTGQPRQAAVPQRRGTTLA